MKSLIDIFESFNWQQFHFLRPPALWLLVPLAVMVILLLMTNWEKKKWTQVVAPALRPFMFSKGSKTAILLPLFLLLLGGSCMIVALAGPTWKKRDIPGEKIPAVVMIALDVSQSMLATDVQPNRLERAKLKISDFLDANPRARAGLLAFAGTAHPVLPFTADYKIIKFHAGSLYNWAMPVQGTNYPLLMNMVDTLMSRVQAPSTLLLMTDAVDDNDAVLLSDFVNNSIHRLEVLLFSTPEGAVIPGSHHVISKQSPTALANLQQNEKIHINFITLDKSDVEGIAKRISDGLMFEKDKKEDAKEWDDMGLLLLIPALIIALFWFRRGWVVQWCWLPLVLLTLSSCGTKSRHPDWWYTHDYQGQQWYAQGDYANAAEHFDDPGHKAAAYYKAGNYEAASELFANDTTASGQYNYALALAQMGLYAEAATIFEKVGAMDPSLKTQAEQSAQAAHRLQAQADSVMRFDPQHGNPLDKVIDKTEKGKLKERKPQSEDEQLSSDTEVKKLPTHGDRLTDETESDIHRAKEQKFPPKDFKMEQNVSLETKVLMQQTNADPAEFLHRRFEIQKQKYYPKIKQGKDIY